MSRCRPICTAADPRRARGRTRAPIERRGITFETDAYVVDEHLVWGATARIIETLLDQLGCGTIRMYGRGSSQPSG